ncbi:MAG: hypothetical protein IPG76_22855 [Acidobacteria bacterium]|nr:hypothetical protein [Acidobacteriota bacterium]
MKPISILALHILFVLSVSGQPQPDLTTQINAVLQERYLSEEVDLKQHERLSRSFDNLFTKLVETAPSTSDETGAKNKLLAIASYKRSRPELFQEIDATYAFGVSDPQHRAPRSPALMAKHATEQYRLVWEYYLLKPTSVGYSDQFTLRIVKALSRINNPKSNVSIEFNYLNTTKPAVALTQVVAEQQQYMLTILGNNPSTENLYVLLNLLSISNIQRQSQTNRSRLVTWQPESYVKSLFSDNAVLISKNRWRDVIGQIDRSKLTAQQRRLLDDLTPQ